MTTEEICLQLTDEGIVGQNMAGLAESAQNAQSADTPTKMAGTIGAEIRGQWLKKNAGIIISVAGAVENGPFDETSRNHARQIGVITRRFQESAAINPTMVAEVYVERGLGDFPCTPTTPGQRTH